MSDFEKPASGNVARGLQAAINNPNVPDSTKKKDFDRLQSMGEDYSGEYRDDSDTTKDKGYDGPSSHTRGAQGENDETNAKIASAVDIQEKETPY